MKEIQRKLSLVQVSEGSSYQESTATFSSLYAFGLGWSKMAKSCSLCCLSAEAPFASKIKINYGERLYV